MVEFSRVCILQSKGVYKLISSLQPLAQQIEIVKRKLYLTIETKKDLTNKNVYLLSTELDKLICQYQIHINQKA